MTVKKETGMKLSCLSTDAKPTASDYAVGTVLVETDTGRIYINNGNAWQDLKLYGLTSGSIPFAGTDGEITEDNSNLFWDNTNKRLGIGTADPSQRFHVYLSSDDTSYPFYIGDGTYGIQFGNGTNYGFAPVVIFDAKDSNDRGGWFIGRISPSSDTGTTPVFVIDSRTTSGSITTRPIFAIENNTDSKFLIDAGGAVGIGTTTPNSKLQINGSLAVKRTATAEDYTTSGETIVGVTDTTAARTITLATADCVEGRLITIKDESGGAGTHSITIATEGSETIDGASTVTISTNYGCIRLYSNGNNWFTI